MPKVSFKDLIVALVLLSVPLTASARYSRHYRTQSYSGGYGQCGRVVFNCDKHIVTIGGQTSPINCGRSTPTSHRGVIGSPGRAAGSVWPSMRGAPILNIGLGNVVVHLLPPQPWRAKTPAGYNTMHAHTGCINVSKAILHKLNQCRGTPYQIVFNTKFRGSSGTRYARRAKHYRHYARRRYSHYTRYADATW